MLSRSTPLLLAATAGLVLTGCGRFTPKTSGDDESFPKWQIVDASEAPPSGPALPPPVPVQVQNAPLLQGQPTTLWIDVFPGYTVTFIASIGGTGAGACPPALGGECLGILPPLAVVGTDVANLAGRAEISAVVPAALPAGQQVWFQAAIDYGVGVAISEVSSDLVVGSGGPTGDTGPAGVPEVVINEIMADPQGADDTNCDGVFGWDDDQFIEIANTGTAPIDLAGAAIWDGPSVLHTFPAPTVLTPGGAVVVWGGGAPAFDKFNPDFCRQLPSDVLLQTASTGALSFIPNGDMVFVVASNGVDVYDTYVWGPEGNNVQSLVRIPEMTAGSPFQQHSSAPGAVNPYSPGTRVDLSTLSGAPGPGDPNLANYDLLINEVFPDAQWPNDANCDGVVTGNLDQFVEIINLGPSFDLAGSTLWDDTQMRHTFPAGSVLNPGDTMVVFAGGTPVFDTLEPSWCRPLQANVFIQTASTGSFSLTPVGDEFTLVGPDNITAMDTVSWGAEGNQNTSLNRSPDGTHSAFFAHNTVPGNVNAWSPGTRVDLTPINDLGGGPTPDLVINEVLADPPNSTDVNCDGSSVDWTQELFMEIGNVGATTVDLTGLQLWTNEGPWHVFPASSLDPGQIAVVFGGGAPTFGGFYPTRCTALGAGVVVQTSSLGGPSFSRSSNTVQLATADLSTVIDSLTYGSEANGDNSLVRDPELTGSFVQHISAAGAAGQFSPGKHTDLTNY